jgi:hypothetical protein
MRTLTPLLLAGAAASASAAPITFTLDPARSSVEVELCVNLFTPNCDTDSSPAVGTIVLDLQPGANPTTATILDFDAQASQDISPNVSFGFLGSVSATASGLALQYAGLPAGTGPFVIDGAGDFTVVDLTLQSAGTVSYNVTGAACAAISPQPCSGVEDFGAAPPETLGPFVANLSSDGTTYTLEIAVTIEDDLVPANPGLVLATVSGTLVATAPVPAPCPEDTDGSGTVDLADLLAVLADFGQPLSGPTDVNGSGGVDLADLLAVLAAFGTTCP